MKIINVTPYTLNVYKNNCHWNRNRPVYTAAYADRASAERAIKLIANLHPSYRFEIIAEKRWLA